MNDTMSPYQPPGTESAHPDVPSATHSNTPRVFGILHLVFGGLGIVFGIIGIIGVFAGEAMRKLQFAGQPQEAQDAMAQAMQPVYDTQVWDVASTAVSIVLAILLIVSGINLLRYRRLGLKISNIYSGISIVHKVAVLLIVLLIKAPAMKLVAERMEQAGGDLGAMSSMVGTAAIVTGIATAVIMSIYPILSYILLNKKAAQESLKG